MSSGNILKGRFKEIINSHFHTEKAHKQPVKLLEIEFMNYLSSFWLSKQYDIFGLVGLSTTLHIS